MSGKLDVQVLKSKSVNAKDAQEYINAFLSEENGNTSELSEEVREQLRDIGEGLEEDEE